MPRGEPAGRHSQVGGGSAASRADESPATFVEVIGAHFIAAKSLRHGRTRRPAAVVGFTPTKG